MGRDGAGRGDDDGGWIDGIRVCFYILGGDTVVSYFVFFWCKTETSLFYNIFLYFFKLNNHGKNLTLFKDEGENSC